MKLYYVVEFCMPHLVPLEFLKLEHPFHRLSRLEGYCSLNLYDPICPNGISNSFAVLL